MPRGSQQTKEEIEGSMRTIKLELEVVINDDLKEDDIIEDDILVEILEGAGEAMGVEGVKVLNWEDIK
jgi:hypothetical protein